jgi:hypothetical protein
MSIAVVCRACDRSVNVKDDLAGRKIKCPGCGKVLAVPDEEVDEEPRRKRNRDREEDEEDRPRRKGGKKKSKKGLIIGLSVGGGVLAVGLVILLIVLLGGSRDNPNVTEENFDKIKRGTSQEEVEKLLGKGDKVSKSTLDKALHAKPSGEPPVKGGREAAAYYRWKNKDDSIFLLITLPGEGGPMQGVMAGWFVREKKRGKPKYKLLGFGKLE